MRKLLLALALGTAFIVPTMAQNQQQPPEKWSDRWFKELTDPNTQMESAKDFWDSWANYMEHPNDPKAAKGIWEMYRNGFHDRRSNKTAGSTDGKNP